MPGARWHNGPARRPQAGPRPRPRRREPPWPAPPSLRAATPRTRPGGSPAPIRSGRTPTTGRYVARTPPPFAPGPASGRVPFHAGRSRPHPSVSPASAVGRRECPRPWRGTPRRTAPAMPAGTSGAASPVRYRRASRGMSLEPEPGRAYGRDPPHVRQRLGQRRRARRGDPVRPPPVIAAHRLDQPALVQPRNRPVQRARPQPHPGEVLDVLGQRVPVLRPLSQADQDQQRRIARPAKPLRATTRRHDTFLLRP